MTDLQFDAPLVPEAFDPAASTPLRRVARRLEAVLPPGWEVDIVDPFRADHAGQPVLRVRMPEN
ncbi:hypothetical protein ACWDSJ_12735 [Nocardia sp. NPDC003482]|uniref:hypothetical protein n=1 Tax=Nocardia sp. NPDC004068 TaxID=3364303 RepID=UPI0036C8F007